MQRLSITHWAEEDRPREKMVHQGPSALSDAELLAILIGSGSGDESAVDLMRKVMNDCRNSLGELSKLSMDELCRYKGIGPAKAVTILAAVELGRRRREEAKVERQIIKSSRDVYEYFYPLMCDLPTEECWVLLLNQALKIIDRVRVATGGWTATIVDIRFILREALIRRAVAVAICHNHPSGNAKPSNEDDNLTKLLVQSARTMNIRMLDHIILTDGAYYSYSDEGKL